jgi:hypothetical protein
LTFGIPFRNCGFAMLRIWNPAAEDIAKLYLSGGWQYEKSSDTGEGTSFWSGKKETNRLRVNTYRYITIVG